VRGRVAHEAIFNVNDGSFRCPIHSRLFAIHDMTRGLAWAMCGLPSNWSFSVPLTKRVTAHYSKRPRCQCDFFIKNTPTDASRIGYRAPSLHKLAITSTDPRAFNEFEPVDSSAAAIAAQGLLRFGHYLARGQTILASRLSILNTLFDEPYLSTDTKHQV